MSLRRPSPTAFFGFILLTAAAIIPACSAPAKPDTLKAEFVSPPDAARPWVYWFVMDGNLSREGITADFEALKRAGIGGVIIMEVDVGIPRGPVKFMSPEWRALFKHAVAEAERLGLQITLNAGPGWTGSGGPWVKPEQSMQHLVASAVEVARAGNASTRSCPARSGARPSSATARCRRSCEKAQERVLPRRGGAGLSDARRQRAASPTSTRRRFMSGRRILRSRA